MTASYARLRRRLGGKERGQPPLNIADRLTLLLVALSALYLGGHVVWAVIR